MVARTQNNTFYSHSQPQQIKSNEDALHSRYIAADSEKEIYEEWREVISSKNNVFVIDIAIQNIKM